MLGLKLLELQLDVLCLVVAVGQGCSGVWAFQNQWLQLSQLAMLLLEDAPLAVDRCRLGQWVS